MSILVASVALSGCFGSKVYRWHQKVTVTVTSPDGEKSGNAVVEETAQLGYNQEAAGQAASLHLKGEATIVDLGQGRYLFALLNEDSKYLTEYAFQRRKDEGPEEFWKKLEASTGSSAPIPAGHYPLLVTFADLNDPKSVNEVKPTDLAASFGAGYALKSITLQITDENVTEGKVEKVLPWLRAIWPNMLDGERYHAASAINQLANTTGAGSFSTEISK